MTYIHYPDQKQQENNNFIKLLSNFHIFEKLEIWLAIKKLSGSHFKEF